jgi:ABC-2 type transport system ATP-binding protein
MIEVEKLTKYYGKRLAVDNISFKINKGEIVGFLGPNAAGKTTTMRIIAGYLSPTLGNVKISGYDILSHSLEARRHLGYLPESVPLYTDMTIHSYLEYMGRLRDIPRDKLKSRVDGVIEQCHLTEYTDVLIGKLSKGFRQRVGIAQAIIHQPEVLIFDEPTIGIDPIQIASTRQLIRQLGKERTVLISTHILPEVSAICERVIIIDHGKVVAEDRIENLSPMVTGSKRIRLEVEGPTKKISERLHSIKGVTRVIYQDSRFIVEYPADQDLRSKISEAIVQGGFTLLSSETVEMSLEDIFLKLTTKDDVQEKDE